jgi:hypothetical protein
MSKESILIIYLIIMTFISILIKEFEDIQEGIFYLLIAILWTIPMVGGLFL